MPDYYGIIRGKILDYLRASAEGYSLRPISLPERTAVEDWFFSHQESVAIPHPASLVIFPNVSSRGDVLNDFATLSEFAIAILMREGYTPVIVSALFSGTQCTKAEKPKFLYSEKPTLSFPNTLKGVAVPQWLRRCHNAYNSEKNRINITAERYIRYIRAVGTAEGLLDLCISLESMLDSQTEISFRFSVCLSKAAGRRGKHAEEAGKLLSDLYDLRSRIVHGDPGASKLFRRIIPSQNDLLSLARSILLTYFFYLSEHTRKEWTAFLKACPFN